MKKLLVILLPMSLFALPSCTSEETAENSETANGGTSGSEADGTGGDPPASAGAIGGSGGATRGSTTADGGMGGSCVQTGGPCSVAMDCCLLPVAGVGINDCRESICIAVDGLP